MKYLVLLLIFVVGLVVMAHADSGPFAGIIWATGLVIAIGVPAWLVSGRERRNPHRLSPMAVRWPTREANVVPTHSRHLTDRTAHRRVA